IIQCTFPNFLCLSGAVGSPFLVQMPSTLKVTTGETFSLNCSLRNGRLDPDYLWYRGFNRSTASVVPSRSGRVFYSTDENGASLTVTGSRRADSGQYFCAVSHNGEKIFSNGTQVYVKAFTKIPAVLGLPSSVLILFTNIIHGLHYRSRSISGKILFKMLNTFTKFNLINKL
uniref:Ig-like domain-containing protein n=1 Tax=Erpetoichthys calabaricus TaxID=27687 RepID=A0A8C4RS90_ERPCA